MKRWLTWASGWWMAWVVVIGAIAVTVAAWVNF